MTLYVQHEEGLFVVLLVNVGNILMFSNSRKAVKRLVHEPSKQFEILVYSCIGKFLEFPVEVYSEA